MCHGIPGDRVLEEGDILNVDVSAIVDGFAKKLREAHIRVAVVDHYDESMHAKFCNNNDVDLYIGIYPVAKNEKSVSFYSAKGFESPGGTYFTELFGKYFRNMFFAILARFRKS